MFQNKDKNPEQFHVLIEAMKNSGRKQPPENFTAEVMDRLAEEKETLLPFSLRRFFSTNLNFSLRQSVTRTECAFYFLLTGFFYSILGLIMITGLPLPVVMQSNDWLAFQPLFGLLLGAELTALGLVIYKKGNAAIRFVRIGTLLYAALIILNSGIGSLYIQPASAIFFIEIFSMTGLVLAVLLGLAIDHYHPGNVLSEVR
ncbi:MAG: hypothetical protein ABFD76_09945 [Smithella sp.]